MPTVLLSAAYLDLLDAVAAAEHVEGTEDFVENVYHLVLAFFDQVIEVADVTEEDSDLTRVVGDEVLWGKPGLPETSKVVRRSRTNLGMRMESFSLESLVSCFSLDLVRKSFFSR